MTLVRTCCCENEPPGCCNCGATMPSSYLVNWSGFCELVPESCAEFATCYASFPSLQNRITASVTETALNRVVTWNAGTCSFNVTAQTFSTSARSYSYPCLDCSCETINSTYTATNSVTVRLFAPDSCAVPPRPYWEVRVQTSCGRLTYRTASNYSCTPTGFTLAVVEPFGNGALCQSFGFAGAKYGQFNYGTVTVT